MKILTSTFDGTGPNSTHGTPRVEMRYSSTKPAALFHRPLAVVATTMTITTVLMRIEQECSPRCLDPCPITTIIPMTIRSTIAIDDPPIDPTTIIRGTTAATWLWPMSLHHGDIIVVRHDHPTTRTDRLILPVPFGFDRKMNFAMSSPI